MKESIVYLKENPATVQEECSEEKCINCFANSGCLYDHSNMANQHALNIDLSHKLSQAGEYSYRQY